MAPLLACVKLAVCMSAIPCAASGILFGVLGAANGYMYIKDEFRELRRAGFIIQDEKTCIASVTARVGLLWTVRGLLALPSELMPDTLTRQLKFNVCLSYTIKATSPHGQKTDFVIGCAPSGRNMHK